MPKVGGKHFDYSPKGIAMAKNAAQKKGVKVQYKKGGGPLIPNTAAKMRRGGAAKKKSGYNPLGNCGLFGRK